MKNPGLGSVRLPAGVGATGSSHGSTSHPVSAGPGCHERPANCPKRCRSAPRSAALPRPAPRRGRLAPQRAHDLAPSASFRRATSSGAMRSSSCAQTADSQPTTITPSRSPVGVARAAIASPTAAGQTRWTAASGVCGARRSASAATAVAAGRGAGRRRHRRDPSRARPAGRPGPRAHKPDIGAQAHARARRPVPPPRCRALPQVAGLTPPPRARRRRRRPPSPRRAPRAGARRPRRRRPARGRGRSS